MYRAAALLVLILAPGCATPRPGLWPPDAGQPTHTIRVSLDTWHAMIAFPLESQPGQPPLFEEWGYAERGWYLEGRQGVSGALRALLWPSAGVVEVTISDRIWAERTPQPPADVFVFQLSETGYQRLRRHLRATIAADEPVAAFGTSRFYPARDAYHLFHQCHQYTARALQEAGLPVSAGAAFTRTSFAMQLERATRLAGGA
jgi:hypothetical protein